MKAKVVIITGASSGIGKALAEEYADNNHALVLAARNIKELQSTADDLRNKCAGILPVQTDVSNESDCKNLIKKSIEEYGKIDILINNAGISMRALFEQCDLSVIKQLMDVNFWGTVFCTKYALPYLLESKGSVTGISSLAGYIGLPGRTGYSASKHAMRGFLDTLRVENRKKKLHVLVVCPGFTTSKIRITALKGDGTRQGTSPRDEEKMMTSEEVARKIRRYVKKHRRTLLLTKQVKIAIGLNKFLPALVDKLVYKHMVKEPESPFK